MTIASDIAWIDQKTEAGEGQILATKLHVLQLESIKVKLGDKWERLSSLVHKLFEKSLRQVQGPADHFLLVDEMSYIVTFHNLSVEEANVACVSVARKVCELLFGSDIDDIAVRGLVGLVPADLLQGRAAESGKISDILERQGREIVVTPKSISAGRSAQERMEVQAGAPWRPIDWINNAHSRVAQNGTSLGFFPVWDLKNRKSASLFLSAFSGQCKSQIDVRRALNGAPESQIVETEITLLNGAAAYAHRIHASQKLCAVGVGVSYETLSGFHSRIRYIGALKAAKTIPTCPLLLRVEQIPDGTLIGRLAEIVTMLSVPNVRVTLDFESLRCLPEFDIRLGAAGLGGSLRNCDSNTAFVMVNKLARRATEQRAFVFLHGIDSSEYLSLAIQGGIRFGSGRAVSVDRCYSGQEAVPELPLQC
ncbi:MAG TPA: hypothetical protein VHC39_08755 [Rhizomicrobium sp.]|nr:hypothetical protein [Rhizomicrobium sp.]